MSTSALTVPTSIVQVVRLTGQKSPLTQGSTRHWGISHDLLFIATPARLLRNSRSHMAHNGITHGAGGCIMITPIIDAEASLKGIQDRALRTYTEMIALELALDYGQIPRSMIVMAHKDLYNHKEEINTLTPQMLKASYTLDNGETQAMDIYDACEFACCDDCPNAQKECTTNLRTADIIDCDSVQRWVLGIK